MTNLTNQQSLKRFPDSIGHLFSPSAENISTQQILFLTSSTDIGVIRNGGRNGAKYGPRSLMASFSRLNKTPAWNNRFLKLAEMANEQLELTDFNQSQITESEKIKALISPKYNLGVVHIGGGHDHIFPLLMAYSSDFKRTIVINIDAHADTRIDPRPHSGTPFRQFSERYSGEFYLYQFGLQPFANSQSTLSPLVRGTMDIIWKNELDDAHKMERIFQQIESLVTTETLVIFSLDADAIDGCMMPGVSAVNGCGLNHNQLTDIWNRYKNLKLYHPKILGIYELNPVYDSISNQSMKYISNFLFESLT